MNTGFAGAAVLLTGSPTPLSITAARRLGNEGASLGLIGRNLDADREVKALLHQFRRSSVAVDADLADPDSVAGAVAEAERCLGPAEVLIHALGSPEPVAESTERGLIIRNSTAPIAASLTCTRTMLGLMGQRRHGHVLHLVSSSHIGALELEQAALARLENRYVPIEGTAQVSVSAVYFDEPATALQYPERTTLERLLESYTGRLVEEEEWTERVLLETGIGDLIVRVCTRSGSAWLGNVQAFGLWPGGCVRAERAWTLSRAAKSQPIQGDCNGG